MAVPCDRFHAALAARGVSFYAGVPDSLLESFCAYVSDHSPAHQHVITANEGGAVALAAGHHMATGEVAMVYLQNSGLGNAVNPLTSLADPAVYGIPMLLLVGWRGEPGRKDEPQHVAMGRMSAPLLDAIGVPHAVLPEDIGEAEAVLDAALDSARTRSAPFAILVPKGNFAPYSLRGEDAATYTLTRERAIELILGAMPADTAVVATTGKPAREVFETRVRDDAAHDSDFLTVGCMGHASQIALGVALGQPKRSVLCLDGDGAALMHLGGLTSIADLAPPNLRHVVLNNGAHDSVGGQPTVGFDIDLCEIAKGCGYPVALRADDEDSLRTQLASLDAAPGLGFLEVRVRKGARADLGRPTNTPVLTKDNFMRFVRA